jgi:polygalacturonase
MLNMERCTNVVLQGWNMRNAAKFHVFFLQNMADVLIEQVTIKVDTDAQRTLLAQAGFMSDGTDGLLPAGVPTARFRSTPTGWM